MPTKVVIVGGGFAGLNAAKTLGHRRDVHVTVIDRRNHHLFQPLLYQVATAGLSPADIFIETLRMGEFLAEADTNRDARINFLDIASFIEILSSL